MNIAVSLLIFLLLCVPVSAQELAPLNLRVQEMRSISVDQAINTALEKNPYLKAELAKSRIADAEIVTARALPNPVLLSDNGVAEDSYRLGIQQTVLLGGKIKNRVRLAQAKKESLSAELRLAVLQLRSDVRNAYARLYSLQERRRILSKLVQDYEEFKHVTADFEDQVQIDFIETTTRTELKEVIYEAQIARNNLNNLLGNQLDTELLIEKPRTSINGNLPLSALLAHAQGKSPALVQNQAQSHAAQYELALAKSQRIPNFSLVVGPDLVTPPEVAQWNVFAIGLLDLPLLNRQQGPIKEAFARQFQLSLAYGALQKKVELLVSNAYVTYQHTLERVNESERILIPEALELQAKAKTAHRASKLTVDTLVEADTHRAAVEIAYLKHLIQNQEAISSLEMVSGQEL